MRDRITELQEQIDALRWELHTGAYAGMSEDTIMRAKFAVADMQDELNELMCSEAAARESFESDLREYLEDWEDKG